MEKMLVLKSSCLENLRHNVEKNLEMYRDGDFSSVLDTISVDIEIDTSTFDLLETSDDDDKRDIHNCEVIHLALENVTPFAARDERLWAYLSHGPLLNYSRTRWKLPTNDDKAISFITSHFFANGKRELETRHAVSRLYWLGRTAARVKGIPLRETLSLILHKQDVRQGIMERPTTLQDDNILTAVIRNLQASMQTDEKLFVRENFRELQERLSLYCGHVFVETLPEKTVKAIVAEIVSDILKEDETS